MGIWVKTSRTQKLVWLHCCSLCWGGTKGGPLGLAGQPVYSVRQKTRWKAMKKAPNVNAYLPQTCAHTCACNCIHRHQENLCAYYSWADSLNKGIDWTRKGRRLGSHVGLSSIQALLFIVWEVRIWSQVHLLTSHTQFFICKMVPSCQTQWDNMRGHLRVPYIMNFLLSHVVKENY